MESIAIRPCSITDIEQSPNIGALCDEYLHESGVPGLLQVSVRFDIYKTIEAAGMLRSFGAFAGDKLVGFFVVTATMMPNYGEVAAMSGAYFVASAYRSTGAGLRLLRAAEKAAKEMGAVGLLIGAPKGGRLADVLPKLKYAEVDRVFFRRFPA